MFKLTLFDDGRAEKYADLVARRKNCDLCHPALQNASRIEGGRWDSDRIGPYSRWQGNLHADLMVVAQDFADVENFIQHEGRPGRAVRTNVILAKVLAAIGHPIALAAADSSDDRLFFTNAVLCMKEGGMRGPVPEACANTCGRLFLRPLVEIVKPKAVVALGRQATVSISRAFGIEPPTEFTAAVGRPIALASSTTLVPVYHPAASRSIVARNADWQRVGEVLSGALASPGAKRK